MAKKTASKKKRTAAQKRATEKMIAANKKKRASKKKAASKRTARKRTATRTARTRTTARGYRYGGARRTNPKDRWTRDTIRYVVRAVERSSGQVYFLGPDGQRTRDPLGAELFNRRDNAVIMGREVNPNQYITVHIAPIEIKMNKKQYEDLM